MNLKHTIKKVLKEEVSKVEYLKKYSKEYGLDSIGKMMRMSDYIKIVYGGDIKEFYRHEIIRPYYIKEGNEVNMYFDDALVQHLNLEDVGQNEKKLGNFKFGNKNGIQYSFDARIRKVNNSYGIVAWKVVGMSGSSGFGYSFIPKRDTLGKKYRKQIFQQIVDKYNLEDYE